MEFKLVAIFAFLSVSLSLLGASHANTTLSPQDYWKAELPNTPMPKAVQFLVDSSRNSSSSNGIGFPIYVNLTFFLFSYAYRTVFTLPFPDIPGIPDIPSADVFFLENNLVKPKNMTLDFTPNLGTTTLLPRTEAQKIPLSSEKFKEILNRFSVKPNSSEAKVLKESIAICEEPRVEGEEKICATSLESMIDFVTTKLGKDVIAFSTDVKRQTHKQNYQITGVRKLVVDKVGVCHKLNYAYVVFNCHKTSTARAYMVSMVGSDGTEAEVAAVCHTDTSGWNPNHVAFQVLKVKPGSVPICHVLPEGHVFWVPK